MGAFKRVMGIDLVDFGIQAAVTGCLTALADAVARSQSDGLVALILAGSTIVFGVRRQRALKRQAMMPETTGEVAALRVEELEVRIAELEAAQQRVVELEERLDFAERLLTRQQDVARVSPPGV